MTCFIDARRAAFSACSLISNVYHASILSKTGCIFPCTFITGCSKSLSFYVLFSIVYVAPFAKPVWGEEFQKTSGPWSTQLAYGGCARQVPAITDKTL